MPTTCAVLMPTIRQIVDVFESLESGLGFIQFQYVPQRPAKRACASSLAAAADTVYSRAGQADPSLVRAYVPHGGVYEGGGYFIFENKDGETLVRLRSMDRRKALPEGQGYYDMTQGEYLWRSFLVGGIKLDTAYAVVNGVKTRLFPNAPEGFRLGY